MTIQQETIEHVADACTGCHACSLVCPVNAISMREDPEGFIRPVIDKKACTQCSICVDVCPAVEYDNILDTDTPEVYAAWSLNEETRTMSTSGGVFSELAGEILRKGGVVAGARYRENFTAEHVIVDRVEDLPQIRQSKYFESSLGDIFQKIKSYLDTAVPVLFCGTPCQAAGLLNYLKEPNEHLVVCDFICRGIPSPMVFKAYVKDLEEHYRSKAQRVQFKNKNIGWNQFCTFIQFENGQTYHQDRYHDMFMYGYLMRNLYMRPCCYECQFKGLPRISDITLGDFWGIGQTRPHLDHNRGTSVVLLNTEKGKDLFGSIKSSIATEKCTIEEAIAGNANILDSVKKPDCRERFFEELKTTSFLKLMERYDRKNSPGKFWGLRLFIKRAYRLMGGQT